ncbi:MAG: MBL fold metallo-hydrolase [Deltaproteobacteria bacterium]|nr:MBL fold metallo-hydrolase [Deltaproteobacteria bacterium]
MGVRGTTSVGALQLRFWGVRGSHPVPGKSTLRFGGNSSCVAVEADGQVLAFDAGTGLIGLGRLLLQRPGKSVVHIFLSHLHHDHIEGLRYFEPVYRDDWRVYLYGPGSSPATVENTLRRSMDQRLFPVALAELQARLSIRTLPKREVVRIPGARNLTVHAQFSRAHPKVGVMLFRIEYRGRSVVYATDVEGPKGGHADVVAFARNADVLIHDSQYTDHEYFAAQRNKAGWGHSTVRMAAEIAREAKVGRLLLYHHDPSHDDKEVLHLERLARSIFTNSQAAFEGLTLKLRAR